MRIPQMLTALALALAGCASVPMAPPADNAAGKTFEPPAPGMAALYVYRGDGHRTVSVSVGQRTLGALASDTWFRLPVAPGPHDIRCRAENADARVVSIAAGETRYVEVETTAGAWGPRCSIIEVSADHGRPAVLAGKRAAEIK